MANWGKLDKEFYEVINSLTNEQWRHWNEQQIQNQKLRKFQKEMELQIHLLKLSMDSFKNPIFLIQDSVINVEFSIIKNMIPSNLVDHKSINNYPLAA